MPLIVFIFINWGRWMKYRRDFNCIEARFPVWRGGNVSKLSYNALTVFEKGPFYPKKIS